MCQKEYDAFFRLANIAARPLVTFHQIGIRQATFHIQEED